MDNDTRNERQQETIRNNVNNANNIRNAAAVAQATGNPYAVAAGKAIQMADKVSGGRSSEALGKAMTNANKMGGLKGRMLQKGLNKMNESGTSDRIAKAANKKNGTSNLAKFSSKGKGNLKNQLLDSTTKTKETEEQASDGEGQNFKASIKFVKMAFIASVPIFILCIFCSLFIAAFNTYLNAISLGQADSVSSSDAEEKIGKMDDSDKDQKVEDEAFIDSYDSTNYYVYDNKSIVLIAKRRKYNEADLSELKDFYSGLVTYTKEYDENLVYDFFFKLYDVYHYYEKNYRVELDMPLLMATLNQQSSDKTIVFSSNIVGYNRENQDVFKYDRDWSSYKPNKKDSSHDIEILAQHMVSRQSTETCVDKSGKETQKKILRDSEITGDATLECAEGETHRTTTPTYKVDNEKYREFLKQFIEEKYYINSSDSNSSDLNTSCPTSTPFKKYELTEDQLMVLAAIGLREQGSIKGAAAEVSLMANLFELRGSKFGSGSNGLYNYVVNSGWFGKNIESVSTSDVTPELLDAVRNVLVNGKRTLPGYIDEHDCINCTKNGGDIESVTNNGEEIDKTDKSKYIQHLSKIKNVYGSTYTFFAFPEENSDPFGYLSEKNREKIGDLYYDFDTGNAKSCSYNSSAGTDLSSAFVSLAVDQLNDPSKDGGEKYWRYMGFNYRVAWCAAFVSWTIENTSYNGQRLKDIIKVQSAVVHEFLYFFYESNDPNVNFYYNDNCSRFSGKNGSSSTYTPKEGDILFFDWDNAWNGNLQVRFKPHHIGIVQRVEDGMIVTIEGNTGDKVGENRFELNDCRVIGFGSWY